MARLVLVLLGVLAVTTFASRAADPPSLKGTWVRESMVGPTMGNQVILTFTDRRVTARFRSGGRDPSGHEGWITLEFEGEYARTDSGLLVGTITGMNVDLSKIPEGDSTFEPIGKSIAKMIGEPFCLRARVVDGALTVTDLKVPNVMIDGEQGSREMIAGFASGKYVSSPTENVPVPKLKVAKANSQNHNHIIGDILGIVWNTCTPRSLPIVKNDLPSPKYLDHYPQYFQPDPVFPPQEMAPGPVPSSGNSSAVMPVTMAPQPMPMPWAMPAPVTFSSRPMPMPMQIPMPGAMSAPVALSPQPMPTVMPASMATMTLPAVPQYVSAEFLPGGFFYFRPCRVEEVITMTDSEKSGLPIVLPVTPAFVPQPAGYYGSVWMPEHENKIRISTPCWLGTTATPISQAMQIPPIDLPVQATFVPRPRKADSVWSPRELLFGSDRSTPKTAAPVPTPSKTSYGLSDYYVPVQSPSLTPPTEADFRAQAEALMNHSDPRTVFPPSFQRIEIGVVAESNPSRETIIREIDLGEAGTMQVIVRMKRDNAKPMLPLPTPVSQLPMQPPVPSTLIPTAGQMLPPGSMRNVPVMPAIADAWKNATRIEGGIMK